MLGVGTQKASGLKRSNTFTYKLMGSVLITELSCHPFRIPKWLGIIPCTYTSCESTAVRNPFGLVLMALTGSFSGGTKSEQAAHWRKSNNKAMSKTSWRTGSDSLWGHSRCYRLARLVHLVQD